MLNLLLNNRRKVSGTCTGLHVVGDELFGTFPGDRLIVAHDDLDEFGFAVDHSTALRDTDDRSIIVGARLEESRFLRDEVEDALLSFLTHGCKW